VGVKREEESSGEWFRIAFGSLYPILYPHRDDAAAAREAAEFVALLGYRGRATAVLDLGCGTGRHAEALIGLGLQVWGLDLSTELLARARRRAPLAGRLVRGDMRALPFSNRFGLVVNLFTSFGYFAADRENVQALREMVRVLQPGGELLIDHIHRAHLERCLVPEDERRAEDCEIHQRRRISGNRVHKDIAIRWDDGRRQHLREDVRLFEPEEIAGLATDTGLENVRLFGSFRGEALTADAQRMILVARKPADSRR